MKRLIPSLALISCLIGFAAAQSSRSERSTGEALPDYLTRQLLLRELTELPTRAQLEAAQRREARHREKQFIEKTQRFVRLWGQFASDYNEKQVFNMKVAQEISKAFHELERSEGWPKVDRK